MATLDKVNVPVCVNVPDLTLARYTTR